MRNQTSSRNHKDEKMKCSALIAVGAIFLSHASAMAESNTAQLRSAPASTPPAKQRLIPERMVERQMNASTAFGVALDDAIRAKTAQQLLDPSRRFQVSVSADSFGKVVRVSNSTTTREWRLASGAGNEVTDATITEIFDMVGLETRNGMSGTGVVSAQIKK
jgi:hypothetical protein